MNRGDRHTTVLVYAAMTVTALALMLFALVANAQSAYTCKVAVTGFYDCGNANIEFTRTPASDSRVLVPGYAAAPGSVTGSGLPASWQLFGSLADSSLVAVCSATATAFNSCPNSNGGVQAYATKASFGTASPPPIPPTPSVAYVKPICAYSNPFSAELRKEWDNEKKVLYLNHYCNNDPTGVRWYPRIVYSADIVRTKVNAALAILALPGFTPWGFIEIEESITWRNSTPEELTALGEFVLKNHITAKVTNSTAGATTAPMYSRKADGTQGATLADRANVGAPCAPDLRLVSSTGKATGYYAVIGTGGYATCKLTGVISK